MIKQQIRLNTVETWVTVLNLSPYQPTPSARPGARTDPMSGYVDSRILAESCDDRHTTSSLLSTKHDTREGKTYCETNHPDRLEHPWLNYGEDVLIRSAERRVYPRSANKHGKDDNKHRHEGCPFLSGPNLPYAQKRGTHPSQKPSTVSRYPDTDSADTKRTQSRGRRRISDSRGARGQGWSLARERAKR